MSTGDKKRKRDEVTGEVESQQPQKVQIVTSDVEGESKRDKTSHKSKKGEAKQKRSERKKKTAITARKNAAAKHTFEPGSTGNDELAAGQDFVSIADPEVIQDVPTALVPFQRRERKFSTSKRVSPRSLRKQKKAANIATALAESGILNAAENDNTAQGEGDVAGTSSSKPRFIVFVGNLPYDTTSEQIQAHFAKIHPASVRHQTDKATGQSKGFAFLEFANYDRMKTCLQLYHNSIFEPNASGVDRDPGGLGPRQTGKRNQKRTRGRRINVELTAGGGGKGSNRQKKIKEKNEKLSEERGRTKLKQAVQAAEQKRTKILKAEKEAKEGKKTGANATVVGGSNEGGQNDMGTIHPSRLNRVKR